MLERGEGKGRKRGKERKWRAGSEGRKANKRRGHQGGRCETLGKKRKRKERKGKEMKQGTGREENKVEEREER